MSCFSLFYTLFNLQFNISCLFSLSSNKFNSIYISSGVYDDPKCTNERSKVNHGVVVVGYGRQDGKDFWIVKNSWGYTWGEQGFNKVVRNNKAGLEIWALVALVATLT